MPGLNLCRDISRSPKLDIRPICIRARSFFSFSNKSPVAGHGLLSSAVCVSPTKRNHFLLSPLNWALIGPLIWALMGPLVLALLGPLVWALMGPLVWALGPNGPPSLGPNGPLSLGPNGP